SPCTQLSMRGSVETFVAAMRLWDPEYIACHAEMVAAIRKKMKTRSHHPYPPCCSPPILNSVPISTETSAGRHFESCMRHPLFQPSDENTRHNVHGLVVRLIRCRGSRPLPKPLPPRTLPWHRSSILGQVEFNGETRQAVLVLDFVHFVCARKQSL